MDLNCFVKIKNNKKYDYYNRSISQYFSFEYLKRIFLYRLLIRMLKCDNYFMNTIFKVESTSFSKIHV